MEDRQGAVADARIDEVLDAAQEYFADALWSTASGEAARRVMVERGLSEKTMKSFGVGFAPVSAGETLDHMRELGYTDEEMEAAGIATRSPRGRTHSHFHSRVMFPVRDRDGRLTGFAGLGTHVGPSWALWVTSPDTGHYSRGEAVFAIDRAAKKIKSTKTAVVLRDCVEVLIAHQKGRTNAVTVHTGSVTPEQIDEMAAGIPKGADALKLDLAEGMAVDREPDPVAPDPVEPSEAETFEPPRYFELKKLALVSATALAAMNLWTGAPLLAVWVGSQAQGGQVLSGRGVVTVLVVMAILVGLLAWALMWLIRKYDEITGRPAIASETSPWHRAKRGDRVQDIRSRYGISAPEKIVIACVVAAVLALEVWFLLFAEAPF